jgi:hypothetical protein
MNSFALHIEEALDRRAVRLIWERVASKEEYASAFALESSAIYRIPLPDVTNIKVSLEETGQSFSWRRPWFEWLGFGCRAYLLDAAPMALFDRPLALFIVKGRSASLVFESYGTGNLVVNTRNLPLFDAGFLSRITVHNQVLTARLWQNLINAQLWYAPPIETRILSPLHGPWPPTDRPVPDSDPTPSSYVPTPPPALGPNEPPPTFLFYGICFQGYSDIDPVTKARTDPLWDEVLKVAEGFQKRGYRSRAAYAGGSGLDGGLIVDTFDMMIQSLDRSVPQTYCNSPKDQMVLFVAAHGYGGAHNPTNKIAMHWQTASRRTEEWITHESFWQKLQQSVFIRKYPEKVILLVESCRSGALFSTRPSSMMGTKLFTAAPDGDTLCHAFTFSHCIRSALTDSRVDTWEKFLDRVKYCLKVTGSKVQPRNG